MDEGMDQISRPMRFALVAVLLFAAAWFTVLRPQAADESDAPLPVASTPTTTPERPAAPAERPGAAGTRPARRPAAGADAAAPPRLSRPVVLLFAGRGADDRVAREVVSSVRRRTVRTVVARLGEVDRYRSLVGGLTIDRAPTIVVISRDRQARLIVGLPDRGQILQALRASP
jgi:hypothetical protein